MLAIPMTAFGQKLNDSSVDEKNQEEIIETTDSKYTITVSGLFRVKVTISAAKDNDHIFRVWLKFGNGDKFKEVPQGEGLIKGASTTYTSRFLFIHKLPWNNNGKINSNSGTVKVFVEIRDPIGNGKYYCYQDEVITGTYSGITFNW